MIPEIGAANWDVCSGLCSRRKSLENKYVIVDARLRVLVTATYELIFPNKTHKHRSATCANQPSSIAEDSIWGTIANISQSGTSFFQNTETGTYYETNHHS